MYSRPVENQGREGMVLKFRCVVFGTVMLPLESCWAAILLWTSGKWPDNTAQSYPSVLRLLECLMYQPPSLSHCVKDVGVALMFWHF